MRVLNILLLIFITFFATTLTEGVSADSHKGFCYNSENGGTFCFEDRHACEVEQKNDLMADSWCSKQTK
ncbi:MAG TPA: hypothetical protein VE594_02635 [Nitrososphaeraceae archaeon]|nr:hypothetical protein [Nitrososphaeraceae archaeon]